MNHASGYWAGLWPWGVILGATKGTVLGGSRAVFLDMFQNQMQFSRTQADLYSGFLAGGVQGAAMSPLLLARTRVNQYLIERSMNSGPSGVISSGFLAEMKISTLVLHQGVRDEGLGVIFRGMPTMMVKRSLDWGSRFYFIRLLTDSYKDWRGLTPTTKLDDLTSFGLSFAGGVASCAVTNPIDRMMPILQQSKAAESPFVFLRNKLALEGVRTLFKGMVLRSTHAGYHTVFATVVADKMYNMIIKN